MSVRRVLAAAPTNPVSLRLQQGTSCPVVGVTYWLRDDERRSIRDTVFYLRREASNKHDVNAVAVYAGDRKIGYLSRGMAARYAPLLDPLVGPFVVNRDLSRARISLIMPPVKRLREVVERKSR